MILFSKQQRNARPPGREEEGLPEAVAHISLEIKENS